MASPKNQGIGCVDRALAHSMWRGRPQTVIGNHWWTFNISSTWPSFKYMRYAYLDPGPIMTTPLRQPTCLRGGKTKNIYITICLYLQISSSGSNNSSCIVVREMLDTNIALSSRPCSFHIAHDGVSVWSIPDTLFISMYLWNMIISLSHMQRGFLA